MTLGGESKTPIGPVHIKMAPANLSLPCPPMPFQGGVAPGAIMICGNRILDLFESLSSEAQKHVASAQLRGTRHGLWTVWAGQTGPWQFSQRSISRFTQYVTCFDWSQIAQTHLSVVEDGLGRAPPYSVQR
jgi:hypothetical protein